ncbi:putative receptor-like protein kinase [Canna indica]|uniref:non-specific serine/threonine protein kinase n=1 Tax=Canna indica TaxID=4628 RepID=A0AAQ3JKT3_9LILI|nr:putative receptor-like protein kinase [Canna indica]
MCIVSNILLGPSTGTKKMSSDSSLNAELSQKTPVFGLRLWVVIGICVGVLIVFILSILSIWVTSKRKTKRTFDTMPISQIQIPNVSKEITVDRVGNHCFAQTLQDREGPFFLPHDKFSDMDSGKTLAHLAMSKSSDVDNMSQSSSVFHNDRAGSSYSGDEGSSGPTRKAYSAYALVSASPLVGLPESSHLGWGHWFTLRDLELATNRFSKENVLGEGGYGVVYRGRLVNGTEVAVKKLLNNLGQAEKEFRVEVEAIGHVRHKNLVRLLGYCIEGIHRMLVYEYVNNGNLEQWLHGAMRQHGVLSWENRMKIILGTAKAYVAPEYANTGLLNEKSDVYSFGVLLLETVTGRDPVDYGRPANEVNLVEWLKMMVGNRRAEEVVDPNLEVKPATRPLKRTLLVALRCVDPDSDKRPKMGQVVRMLEADEVPYREDRRNRRNQAGTTEVDAQKDNYSSSDPENNGGRNYHTSDRFQA